MEKKNTVGWSRSKLRAERLGGCQTCEYFSHEGLVKDATGSVGYCMLNPPVIVGEHLSWDKDEDSPSKRDIRYATFYPVVGVACWCGQRVPVSKEEFINRLGDDDKRSHLF